jgi:hypothetical protein
MRCHSESGSGCTASARRLWPLKVRDASAHVNRTRLGAVAARVLEALNWLRVLWLALLLALLPRC